MIQVNNLKKTYARDGQRVEALKSVSINVEKGEIFGVIGLSGAGKSSLVRCISSLEKPDEGTIIINGQDIARLSKKELRQAQKKIGLVFQHFNLLMNSTVYQNIAFPLEISKMDKAHIDRRVEELLEMVDLVDKKDVYPSMLSGGQKQRVGIARALAGEPDILMCDEATSALDPATTKSILDLLKSINKKLNITILVITHEMDVIKELCHKVAILEHGLIIEMGSVIDVFINPKTQTAKTFFNSIDTELSNKVYKKVLEKAKTVLKVIFIGENSTNPYISHIITTYNLQVAILAGNIQQIGETVVGGLVIEIDGAKDNITKAMEYLASENILMEVIHREP